MGVIAMAESHTSLPKSFRSSLSELSSRRKGQEMSIGECHGEDDQEGHKDKPGIKYGQRELSSPDQPVLQSDLPMMRPFTTMEKGTMLRKVRASAVGVYREHLSLST